MDAIYFRDKAEACLRLAKGLSWNNPARGELMELAQEFQRQAKELEAAAEPTACALSVTLGARVRGWRRPARNITANNPVVFSKD
jgi:hypothetical protein